MKLISFLVALIQSKVLIVTMNICLISAKQRNLTWKHWQINLNRASFKIKMSWIASDFQKCFALITPKTILNNYLTYFEVKTKDFKILK